MRAILSDVGKTERVLRLLDLLQSRPTWTGPQLAEQLGVTTRSVRRDVDRLRTLGYPVEAAQGSAGGYRLGAGTALPPLLLSDEEAVAVAVSLRLAAGGTVAGASEAAVRTLAKLDQVLPPRLRAEVRAIQESTDTLLGSASPVDGDVLLLLARACRDRVRVRLGYTSRQGEVTRRLVEPVRLVATSRRWYLVAHDVDRDDWRVFRLDRMAEVEASTWRFVPREHPDPVALVQEGVAATQYRHVARVRLRAARSAVVDRVGPLAARVEEEGDESCVLVTGAEELDHLVVHLLLLDMDLEVLDPPELRLAMARAARRLAAAAAHDPEPPVPPS